MTDTIHLYMHMGEEEDVPLQRLWVPSMQNGMEATTKHDAPKVMVKNIHHSCTTGT